MIFNFRDRTVTREFREALALELPGLGGNRSYWGFLAYLLFGTFRNDDGELMLAREVLASIEGKKPNHHYNAADLINGFRQNVLHFEVEHYSFSDDAACGRRVRTVKSLVLPADVDALVKAERRSKGGDRVYMSTGSTYLRKHASAAHKQDRQEAEQRALDKYVSADTALLLSYVSNPSLKGRALPVTEGCASDAILSPCRL